MPAPVTDEEITIHIAELQTTLEGMAKAKLTNAGGMAYDPTPGINALITAIDFWKSERTRASGGAIISGELIVRHDAGPSV